VTRVQFVESVAGHISVRLPEILDGGAALAQLVDAVYPLRCGGLIRGRLFGSGTEVDGRNRGLRIFFEPFRQSRRNKLGARGLVENSLAKLFALLFELNGLLQRIDLLLERRGLLVVTESDCLREIFFLPLQLELLLSAGRQEIEEVFVRSFLLVD